MVYEALGSLLATCAGILSFGVIGVIGAFLFGYFGTWQRAKKKNEWEFNYSIRARESQDESGLPVNRKEAICFPSLTACLTYVIAVSALFRWIVIIPNAQALYNCWFLLYRSSSNESALAAMSHTAFYLVLIVSIAMGLAMRRGRLFKTAKLQRRENLDHGKVLPVRSRGLMIYPMCFVCTFIIAMCEKASKKSVAK